MNIKPEEEAQILNNILIFLRRTNLSGDEVVAFNQAMTYLVSKAEAVNIAAEAIQASQGKAEE